MIIKVLYRLIFLIKDKDFLIVMKSKEWFGNLLFLEERFEREIIKNKSKVINIIINGYKLEIKNFLFINLKVIKKLKRVLYKISI